MLKKEIEICGKKVPFRSSATIPRLYRAKFKRDIFKDLSKLEKSYKGKTEDGDEFQIEDLEIFENVAYIMAYHADNNLWVQIGTGYTMDGFRRAVKAAMGGTSSGTDGHTKIMGDTVAAAEQMKAYLKAKNPNVAQSVLDMVPLYLSEGRAEGVRGDIAFAQSCLETGNFTFSGSAVTLSQNNFCGMGVTSNGMKGNSFDTPQLGIRAQVQHLKAYASTDALKNACIDPRFKYVTRGCAEYVEWLGQKENPDGKGWAAGAGYGEKILSK